MTNDETYTVDQFRKLLSEAIVNFVFTKVDDTKRVMRGTTNLEVIPYEDHPKGKNNKVTTNTETSLVRVYDLDNSAWRSLYHDSVYDVNVEERL